MTADLVTLLAVAGLGVALAGLGVWSGRHLDLLVGGLGSAPTLAARRRQLRRGSRGSVLAGLVVLAGCLVLAVLSLAT
jgi:hypothetical protein